jgi:histidinol-phosphate phosphatase family protein
MSARSANRDGGRLDTVPAKRIKAVFLDKDGTLVHDVPFNVDVSRLSFTAHAMQALRVLDDAGYAIFIVTNQPGLSTGRFDRTQFDAMRSEIERRIHTDSAVRLAGVYVCPHAPDSAGRPACQCRKPSEGLLLRAAAEHGLDLTRCWMVGDILNDVEAGRRAGCGTVLLDAGNETEWEWSGIRTPDLRCQDLLQAARAIVSAHRGDPSPLRTRNMSFDEVNP